MPDYFAPPADGVPDRAEIEQRESEGDDIFALREMATLEVSTAMDDLAMGMVSVPQWRDRMRDILSTYFLSNWIVGATGAQPDEAELDALADALAVQYEFLDGFMLDLLNAPAGEMEAKYYSRAVMYAWSPGTAYWRGATRGWTLPAYPRDMTTICGIHCCCSWIIDVLDEENGDVDAYWQLGGCTHCTTCPSRGVSWQPFQIREGEWVVGQIGANHFA